MTDKVQQRRQDAAVLMGVDVEKVEARRIELSQLRENGLLLDLDVHGTSMFSTRVSFAELGIAADDARIKRMTAGRKDLFPEQSKKLRSLEMRVRQVLYHYSFDVTAFGGWCWMPWTAYGAWKDEHERIVAEIKTVILSAVDEWDEIAEENRAFFRAAGARAWKAMLAQYAPGDEIMVVCADGSAFNSLTGREKFIQYVEERGLAKMPTPSEILNNVRVDYRTSILYGEEEIAEADAELAAARAAQAQARAQEAEARRKERRKEREEQLELAKMHDAKEYARLKMQAEVEAYKQAEILHARDRLAQMASPLNEALDDLRANLYDAVNSMLQGLSKNGGFRGRSSVAAAELYRYWRTLNGGLLEDEELDARLAELEAKMKAYQSEESKESREAHIGTITATLHEISALTYQSAQKVGSSRAAALEL